MLDRLCSGLFLHFNALTERSVDILNPQVLTYDFLADSALGQLGSAKPIELERKEDRTLSYYGVRREATIRLWSKAEFTAAEN